MLTSGPLELELKMIMSCLKWALGTKSESWAKAGSTLNCYSISPNPVISIVSKCMFILFPHCKSLVITNLNFDSWNSEYTPM